MRAKSHEREAHESHNLRVHTDSIIIHEISSLLAVYIMTNNAYA